MTTLGCNWQDYSLSRQNTFVNTPQSYFFSVCLEFHWYRNLLFKGGILNWNVYYMYYVFNNKTPQNFHCLDWQNSVHVLTKYICSDTRSTIRFWSSTTSHRFWPQTQKRNVYFYPNVLLVVVDFKFPLVQNFPQTRRSYGVRHHWASILK